MFVGLFGDMFEGVMKVSAGGMAKPFMGILRILNIN